ncbi:MAG: hypothetical protein R3C44_02150 [Chloroflexota bacterium]
MLVNCRAGADVLPGSNGRLPRSAVSAGGSITPNRHEAALLMDRPLPTTVLVAGVLARTGRAARVAEGPAGRGRGRDVWESGGLTYFPMSVWQQKTCTAVATHCRRPFAPE